MIDLKILQKKKPLSHGGFIERNPNVSYLLTAGNVNKESVLIDANLQLEKLKQELKEKRSTLKSIIITHLHGDHIADLKAVVRMFPFIKFYVNSRSSQALESSGFKNVGRLEDGQIVWLENLELVSLFTPGHTFDSISLWSPKYNTIFTGDTLFGGGIGCCDYFNGGNRNIFYTTLQNLLQRLTPETNIYPGHYSEHYCYSPPYLLSGELVRNPYLVSVSKGKRGDFDRALKEFSLEFERDDHFLLSESDINRICELEKEAWIPELQASKETILKRLRSGHKMLALGNNKLLGMISWRYDGFSIKDEFNNFPKDFNEYSQKKSAFKSKARSAFIYNLGVRTSARKQGIGSSLLQLAFESIRNDGIEQVFVDSRIPSYHGSNYGEFENVSPANEFADAIDNYFSQNFFSEKEKLLVDPILRFYTTNGFRPWLIKNEFIRDKSSGNIRIICYMNLEKDEDVRLKVYFHDKGNEF
jgi:glyoxylase-like metal-dependent hydrolase (beta-lactamase superfamily II)/ribosomal protein S18 acetylase RimI-like enzyme